MHFPSLIAGAALLPMALALPHAQVKARNEGAERLAERQIVPPGGGGNRPPPIEPIPALSKRQFLGPPVAADDTADVESQAAKRQFLGPPIAADDTADVESQSAKRQFLGPPVAAEQNADIESQAAKRQFLGPPVAADHAADIESPVVKARQDIAPPPPDTPLPGPGPGPIPSDPHAEQDKRQLPKPRKVEDIESDLAKRQFLGPPLGVDSIDTSDYVSDKRQFPKTKRPVELEA